MFFFPGSKKKNPAGDAYAVCAVCSSLVFHKPVSTG